MLTAVLAHTGTPRFWGSHEARPAARTGPAALRIPTQTQESISKGKLRKKGCKRLAGPAGQRTLTALRLLPLSKAGIKSKPVL